MGKDITDVKEPSGGTEVPIGAVLTGTDTTGYYLSEQRHMLKENKNRRNTIVPAPLGIAPNTN